MPLPPRVGYSVQEHHRRVGRVAGLDEMPADGLAVPGGPDESMHPRHGAQLFLLAVLVRDRSASLWELSQEIVEAGKGCQGGVIVTLAMGYALRWLGVVEHGDCSFQLVNVAERA